MKVSTNVFGKNGSKLFVMENDHGLVLEVSDYGARIVRLLVPNKIGSKTNIVLGFDSAEAYQEQGAYFGATIGRVAGRLKKGRFDHLTETYQLEQNEGLNTLHGGSQSFEEKIWETAISESQDEIRITFSYLSPAAENGFPGTLKSAVTYSLNNQNEWGLYYHATTDQVTLYNPTNHVYFNLAGDFSTPVDNHMMMIAASEFAVIDEESLPTGELRSVKETPFDFTAKEGQPVGQGFTSSYSQNKLVDGYDHPFVLTQPSLETVQASLEDKTTGIKLEVRTDAPAVVVYTTNMGADTLEMSGQTIGAHSGITFETQTLPDAINHLGFGNIVLLPEQVFETTTVFKICYE